jgi:hypothetical protein
MTGFREFLDLEENLTRTALVLRENALRAANDVDDDRLCCWQTEKVGGQLQVVEVRTNNTGATEMAIVTVPTDGSFAEHIAATHPRAMLALAQLLEHQAQRLMGTPAIGLGSLLDRDLKAFVDAFDVDLHD